MAVTNTDSKQFTDAVQKTTNDKQLNADGKNSEAFYMQKFIIEAKRERNSNEDAQKILQTVKNNPQGTSRLTNDSISSGKPLAAGNIKPATFETDATLPIENAYPSSMQHGTYWSPIRMTPKKYLSATFGSIFGKPEGADKEFNGLVTKALNQYPPITNILPNQISPEAVYHTVERALNDIATQAESKPTLDVLRQAAASAIRVELNALQETFKNIDGVNFFDSEKTLMKDLALEYGISSASMMSTLMESARSAADIIKQLATPNDTPDGLASKFFDRILPVQQKLQQAIKQLIPTQPNATADRINELFIRMALASASITKTQAAIIYANMTGKSLEALVGGALWILNEFTTDNAEKQQLLTFKQLLETMHWISGNLAGDLLPQDEQAGLAKGNDTYYSFLENLPPYRIPGGDKGCLKQLQLFSGKEIITDNMLVLSKRNLPLKPEKNWRLEQENNQEKNWVSKQNKTWMNEQREAWKLVLSLMDMTQNTGGTHLSLHWIASMAPTLAECARTRNGKPPSNAELWTTLTDKPMQPDVSEKDFGKTLEEFVIAQQLSISSNAKRLLDAGARLLLPPKLMFHLAEPGAMLKLEDIPIDMGLPPLNAYNPNNVNDPYGLASFSHYPSGSNIAFLQKANDNMIGQLPSDSITLDNQNLQEIINRADAISQSKTQKAKILQSFTQTGTANMATYSQFFPNCLPVDQNGAFSYKAEQQEKGDVIVTITSNQSEQFKQCTQSFTIHPDGTDECTAFLIERA
jgi:hypothetical protein